MVAARGIVGYGQVQGLAADNLVLPAAEPSLAANEGALERSIREGG